MAERIDVVDIEFGNSQQEADKLTKSLDELKQELYALEKGSDAYNKKLQEVAAETKRLTAINEELEQSTQSAGEKFETVLGAAAGFAGAIQIAEGTLQAFGIQSEAAEEAIAKLQGVMAITDGLRTIKENAKAITDLTKLIKNSTIAQRLFTSTKRADVATTNAQTAATVGYTTATTTATVATKVFRTVLLTSGIGAAIAAITYAVGKLSDMWQGFKDNLNLPNLDTLTEIGDTISSTADKVTKTGIYDDIRNMNAETLLKSIKEGTVDIENSLGDLTYASRIFKEEIVSLTEKYDNLNLIQKKAFGNDIQQSITEYSNIVKDLDRIFQETAGDKYLTFLSDAKTIVTETGDVLNKYTEITSMSIEEYRKLGDSRLEELYKQKNEILSLSEQLREEYDKLLEGEKKGVQRLEDSLKFDPYWLVQAENAYENIVQIKDKISAIYDSEAKKQEENDKKQEERLKKQKELAKTIRDVNAELDKAYREMELNQMDSRDAERERLKDNYDSQIAELDSYLAQGLITQEKYQQLSVAYMNEYNRKLIEAEEQWAKEDADAEKARYEEKLQVQRDYISKYINNIENDMVEGLRSLNEAVEKSANDPLQNIFDREKLLAQEKIYLEETIKTYKEIISTLAPELQEEMNSYLVQLEERLSVNESSSIQLLTEKVQTYSNIVSESLSTTSSFMSDIASFGEGVSSEWISVTDIVSESVNTIGEQLSVLAAKIKDGQADWKDYGQVIASSLTSAFQIGSGMMTALVAKQQQIIDDIDGNDAASMKRKADAFEKQKQYEVAGATMSMLGGITAAIATAFQLGPIMGPIIGGINAALVATTGGLQISQIKKQKNPYGGSSSSSDTATPSLSSLQMLGQGVNPTTEVEGASVEGKVTDQRVYVTETDIRNTMNRVQVAESEATF